MLRVFECLIKENNEISILKDKPLLLKATGRKTAIDYVLEKYPNKNVVILGIKKEKNLEVVTKLKGKEIQVGIEEKSKKREISNRNILVKQDRMVFYVIEKANKLFINFKEPIEETIFLTATKHILFSYDNNKKSWEFVKKL